MKILWALMLAMLVNAAAQAEMLRLLDLRLHPDAAWQRGAPQQEEENDALQLSRPGAEGGTLQLLLPRKPPLIKSDSDAFYRNLTRKWNTLYGKAAAVSWFDLNQGGSGGLRWLSCRRPARSGEGVVFQLATVHERRAYSLLVFAPPGTEALPPAVQELMAGARFLPSSTPWRRRLALPLMPRGEAQEALFQAEADALGEKGMLTGIELRLGQPAESADVGSEPVGGLTLHWSLEGFRWKDNEGRDERLPFELRGRLAAQASAELEGGGVKLVLQGPMGESVLAARVSQHSYCGPSASWEAALASLKRGGRAPLSRLAREHACPDQAGEGHVTTMEAKPGQAVVSSIVLAPPPEKAVAYWVEIRPLPKPGSVGEGLLDRLGLYFVYEPEP